MAKSRTASTNAILAVGLAIGTIGHAQNFTLGVDYAVADGVIDSTPPYSVCGGNQILLHLRYSWTNPFQEYVFTEALGALAPYYTLSSVSPNPLFLPASTGAPATGFVDVNLVASSQGTAGSQPVVFRGRTSGFFGNPIINTDVTVPLETLLVPAPTQYLELTDGVTDMPTLPWFSWGGNSGKSNRLDVSTCNDPGATIPTGCGGSVMGSPAAPDCGSSGYCWQGTGSTHQTTTALSADTAHQYRVVASNICGMSDESSSTPPRPFFRTAQACFVTNGTIPDGGTAVFDVGVDAIVPNSVASNLRVTVHTDHADVSDLGITLTKTSPLPAGPIRLVDQQGGSGCLGGQRMQVVFADDGMANTGDCNSQEPAISGRIAPLESLDAFATVSSAGTWRLTVSDEDIDGNVGTLLEWCLSADAPLTPATFTPLTAIATPWVIAFGQTSALSSFGGAGVGAVSYAVTGGAGFCSLDGSTLTGIGIGVCTVTATKAPDGINPEATDTVDVTVVRADQAPLIAVVSPDTIPFGGATEVTASGGSGTGAVSLAVTAGGSFCAINGSTVTGIGVGVCSVSVTKAADNFYNAATAIVDVTVIRADQSPLTALVTEALIGIAATSVISTTGGSGTGDVSFAVTSGATYCSIAGDTATGTGVGTCGVTATKAADANYNQASAVVDIVVFSGDLAGLALSQGALAPPFSSGATSYSASVANAVATVELTAIALDPAAHLAVNGMPLASGVPSPAIALGVGSNELQVVVTAQDSTVKNYQIDLVRRATQTIVFPPVPARVLGDPPFELTLSGGESGQPVIVTSATPAVCTATGPNGVTITLIASGSCVLVANQAGDDDFDAAPEVEQVFEVQPGADLQITKSNGLEGLLPNAPVVYVIEVGNAGPSNVSGALLVDVPPAQLLDPQWACVPVQGAVCDNAAGNGPINESLTLPANSILRFELSAIVSAAPGSFITNTASIGAPAGTVERNPADNIARDIDAVLPDAIYNNGFEPGTGSLEIPRVE